ncbi:MAG: helix-turn-helix transcriptional regulator [Treponema sp.]|jgi:transcriptional regulator with XRE-family HTH domain|nr:helix-turn-helix transcriptional regulator [Treponema sp.]
MTSLRQLLAYNMKEKRHNLGLSQARLAERADLSTQYIAMIELKRKFPSPEMLEKIAAALEIDTPQLFSLPPTSGELLKEFRQTVLTDLEKAAGKAVNKALQKAVTQVITEHLKKL